MEYVEINYLAVLVCAFIPMLIGAMWYGPLFGKAWMAAVGKTEEEIRKDFNPARTYGLTVIANFVVAYTLARIMGYAGAATIVDALMIALLCWLGFTAGTFYINNLFEAKPNKLLVINIFYHLTVLLAYSVILSIWK